jgi:hypothetical protein
MILHKTLSLCSLEIKSKVLKFFLSRGQFHAHNVHESLSLLNVFNNGHDEIVRTVNVNQSRVISGGEDSRLCKWN